MSFDHDNIPYWVQQARKGDRLAFGRIVSALNRALVKYSLYLTRDVEWARDLAQETWAHAVEHLSSYRHDGATFLTWLKTIAYHAFVSQYRRKRLRENLPDRPPPAAPDPLDAAARREILALLKERIRDLPDDQRRALGLYLENGSHAEIAELLGISRIYARVIIYRLMNDLRAFLGLEDDDDRG